jgi:hypothetical protein
MFGSRHFLAGTAIAAAVVLAGAACSRDKNSLAKCQSTTTTAAGTPAPAGTPAGFVAVDVPAEGFSLALPATWKQVVIDDKIVQRLVAEANKKVSRTEQVVNDQVKALSNVNGKLFAYDTCIGTTTLSVVKTEVRGVNLEAVAQIIPAQFTQQGMRDIKTETVTIAAGPAVKVEANQDFTRSDGKKVDLFRLQYYVLSAPQGPDNMSKQFILTLATDDPGRDRPVLEAIGQTFKAA